MTDVTPSGGGVTKWRKRYRYGAGKVPIRWSGTLFVYLKSRKVYVLAILRKYDASGLYTNFDYNEG